MKYIISIFFLIYSATILAQIDSTQIDLKYREDQFYVGITYNLLTRKPQNVNQYNLSRGIHMGFVRDIPINKNRNIGIGIGVGYSYNLFYTNIKAIENQAHISYDIVNTDDLGVHKNYYQNHAFEFIPLEIRWRTSTPEAYKFWRIYSGIKMAYLFGSSYRMKSDTSNIFFKNPDLKGYLEWKPYISVGYGTWNIFFQYSITPIFQNKRTQKSVPMDMNMMNIGFIFYIL